MILREVSLKCGRESLLGQAWVPIGEPKGVVCLIHGLGEHVGRYEHVGKFFANSGYGFMGVDLPGHGRSPGPRGHLGSFRRIMEVVRESIREAQRQVPGAQCFLYGHSMGGGIVLNFLARENPSLAGTVVTSPWLRLAVPVPKGAVRVLGVISKIWPAFAQPNRLSSALLSRDPEVAARYDADPLVHNMITAQTFAEVSRAGEWVMGHPEKIKGPLLLMHGSDDAITDPAASEELARRIGPSCTFRKWDGFYHELHNELGQDKVLGFLRAWLDSRHES
ncbi:MAG TPA: alpha/beta hydrolase [Firmicutes bacterium]|nr:alpha/beta hydrolase [Bacillota bacterium]